MRGWARPGVKCVCIRDNWREPAGVTRCPKIGEELTVAEVKVVDGQEGLFFEEIQRVQGEWGALWRSDFFRPLVPPKTQEQDMEHFLPLLKTRELVE